jgi:outer membrane protein assembly factor BamD
MEKELLYSLALLMIFVGISCKSDFEKLRQEGTAAERLAKAMEYLEEEECYKAQALFESVIGAYRGKPEQEKIYYHYAETHYCQGNYLRAAYYFRDFSATYPNSDFREESDFMIPYSYYQMSPRYRLDQTQTQRAIDEFQLFINTHPRSEKVAECNNWIDECRKKLEKKAFAEGELYYNLKEYQAATVSFENLLKDYPESPNAERVRFLIAKASHKWAENSILLKQEERYKATAKNAGIFLAKHPGSTYTKEVQSIMADSEQILKEISKDE